MKVKEICSNCEKEIDIYDCIIKITNGIKDYYCNTICFQIIY